MWIEYRARVPAKQGQREWWWYGVLKLLLVSAVISSAQRHQNTITFGNSEQPNNRFIRLMCVRSRMLVARAPNELIIFFAVFVLIVDSEWKENLLCCIEGLDFSKMPFRFWRVRLPKSPETSIRRLCAKKRASKHTRHTHTHRRIQGISDFRNSDSPNARWKLNWII